MNRVFSEVVSILGSLLCSLWAVSEQVYQGTILDGKKYWSKDKAIEKEGQSMKGVRIIFVDYLKWIRGHNGKSSKRIQCSRRKVSQGSSILKETICAWVYLIQLPLPKPHFFFWQGDISSCWLWSTKDMKALEKFFVWLVKKGQSTSLYINKLIQWHVILELATCQKGVININPPLYKDGFHWTLSYCSYLKPKTHRSWKNSLVQ